MLVGLMFRRLQVRGLSPRKRDGTARAAFEVANGTFSAGTVASGARHYVPRPTSRGGKGMPVSQKRGWNPRHLATVG